MRRAVLLALLLAGCTADRREVAIRYRITVAVLDRGALRRGSAIWSNTVIQPRLPLVDASETRERTEPVAIRLGDGRRLFVLPRNLFFSGGAATWLAGAFGLSRHSGDGWWRAATDLAGATGRSVTLPCATVTRPVATTAAIICPTLLVATDPADPASVRDVTTYPGRPAPPGAPVVQSLRFTITQALPSDTLPRLLPWLGRHPPPTGPARHLACRC